MKRTLIFLIITLLVGMFIYRIAGPKKEKKEKEEMVGIPVEVQIVKMGSIRETLSISGTIKSENEISVVAKVGGRVKDIYLKEGDLVKRGQLLIKLEDEEIQAQLSQVRAAYDLARTQLQLAQTGARPQEKKQAESAVDMAKAGRDMAEASYLRMKNLYETKAISRQQFEQVETQYKISGAQLDSALQQQSVVDEGARKENKEAAEAQVAQAKAAVEYVETMLKSMSIFAPTDGVIFMKMIDKGEMASPGYPLLILVDNNNLYLEAQIGEKDFEKVKINQAVKFQVDAIPSRNFSGKVIKINPVITEFSRSFKLKIRIEDKDIKSGMFARGEVITQEKKEVVIVPRECIKKAGEKNIVFTVEDKKAKKNEIKIGIINDTIVEVLEGIREGEEIVVAGYDVLKDGDKVNPVRNP